MSRASSHLASSLTGAKSPPSGLVGGAAMLLALLSVVLALEEDEAELEGEGVEAKEAEGQ
jgi:hypothetical protein